MSKQSSLQSKPNRTALTRSNVSLPGRENTLGPHVCVQREAAGPETRPNVQSLVREVVDSPGHPLDAATRSVMEPRLGHDFSRVRVHTDDRAAQSAQAVSANAYTAGEHVVFNAGKYTPGTESGQRLMAHELTHVIQQASGPVEGTPVAEGLSISHPSDRFEQEARARAGVTGPKVGAQAPQGIAPLRGTQPANGQTMVQRSDTTDALGATFGGLGLAASVVGLVFAGQQASAGNRQADAAEYVATGGFAFDSFSFGPFIAEAPSTPASSPQGGAQDNAGDEHTVQLIDVMAGEGNEAPIELTIRGNGHDILGGIVEQGDTRGYVGGARGASGSLVFTGAYQSGNAFGSVATATLLFRGTNRQVGGPIQRFHGKLVVDALGRVLYAKCTHTSGQGGAANCIVNRQPAVIVSLGRPVITDAPESGNPPAPPRRAEPGAGGAGSGPRGGGSQDTTPR